MDSFNMDCYIARQISPGVWDIGDKGEGGEIAYVDAYLITGNDRALLIDAGNSPGDLRSVVDRITGLPVDVLLLHAHPDHVGGCRGFDTIYMNPAEKVLCDDAEFINEFFDHTKTLPVYPGAVFDLGGRVIEIYDMAAHTPGSMVALDRANQLLFSSDSVGSGPIWMHTPFTSSLNNLVEKLTALKTVVADMPDLLLHTGHACQHAKPLGHDYLNDLYSLAKDIIAGKVVGEPTSDFDGRWKGKIAKRGLMTGLSYNPDNLS